MPRALFLLLPLVLTAGLLAAQAGQPDLSGDAQLHVRPLRVVVLDPGHGGDDTGVQSASGLVEEQLTLDLARRIRAVLEPRLGVRVVLTRDSDVSVSPDQRAGLSNAARADAFISLHAGSSARPAASGPEVYVHRPHAPGASAVVTTDALPVPGGNAHALAFVPWNAVQDRHADASATLADTLLAALTPRVLTAPRPRRQMPLRVLAGVDAPALLLEVASLSSPDDAARVGTDLFQAQLADAVVDALARYRDLPPELAR